MLVLSTNGTVEVLRAGAQTWDFASPFPGKNILHPGDQLRTGSNSTARVQMADRTIVPIEPSGHLQVMRQPERRAGVRLLRGLFFFLHRDEPGDVQVLTPTVAAVIRGTEFTIEVGPDGGTTLHLIDGAVALTNRLGHLELHSGEAAQADPGQPPVRTAAIAAANVLQWFLYYPGVLNVDDLSLGAGARQELAASLDAYRAGDLRAALEGYPPGRAPESDTEKVYLAALLLGVGELQKSADLLRAVSPQDERAGQLAAALRRLVAAIRFESDSSAPTARLSTALLAESYYQQSRLDLEAARDAARDAVALAPEFGFARARLAELEFGFGNLSVARKELEESLQLSPRNAQAVATRGFVLAGQYLLREAIDTFDEAIALDGGLGHAWLGRGLCRIKRGEAEAGRRDLEIAAAVEPQRALFRSYLGKAFSNEGETTKALHELDLAKNLDPNDPTAWLYSALLNQSESRINPAIRDLETSRALNDNRGVFRSQSLLDQDQAVRGANLATIYRDAGMNDVAFRQAARAVHDDYANYSGHLFLANSYNQLRDPGQVNLRYETPWLSELLVANLLSPVGAGTLSQVVSDQEYSRLFERNRLGLVSHTEYRSSGDWLQAGAQYGRGNNFGYALEGFYRSENGARPNHDLERLTLSLQFKHQLTAQDTLFFQSIYYDSESGDRAQYYRQTDSNPELRLQEKQEPLLLAGYHRDWAPGVHTLVLAARLHDDLSLRNPTQPVYLRYLTNGGLDYLDVFAQSLRYDSELEVYSLELQQIWSPDPFRVIVGTRNQIGEIETRNRMPGFVFVPQTSETVSSDFRRLNAYAYLHWQPLPSLRLVGGLAYDHLTFPENFRNPPVSASEETEDQVSPKAGVVWDVMESTTLRAAFARSLGGASIDQSFQLEPSQVAGFIQSYRSLIPESAAGPVTGARFDTWGLALDQRFPTDTYLGLTAEWLKSDATRQAGIFEADERPIGPVLSQIFVRPTTTPERLDFDERSLTATLNQLVGNDWAFGARYRISRASLDQEFTDVPADAPTFGGLTRRQELEGTLHQLRLYALFNHSSGLFAGADSVWSAQSNHGYSPDRPGDDFWQFNLHAGYRLLRRRVEARVSLLNLTDQDYRLNPLNLTTELPRERTLAVSLRLSF